MQKSTLYLLNVGWSPSVKMALATNKDRYVIRHPYLV